MGDIVMYVAIGFVGLFSLIFLYFFARYFKLWVQCVFSKANINPFPVDVDVFEGDQSHSTIVQSKIMAVQAGLQSSTNALGSPLFGGRERGSCCPCVDRFSHRANIELDWDTAAAIDLAGRNVLEAVRTSVDPKVIDCPDPNRGASNRRTLDGVAKDGIQLKARARVTGQYQLAATRREVRPKTPSSPAWVRGSFRPLDHAQTTKRCSRTPC